MSTQTSIGIDVSTGGNVLGNLSTLDLRLIRVFLAVTDAGGVSAAQAVLNVGQSTISAQLSSLETRLGYRLCERGRGGFRLTPKGERFHDMSRKLLSALDDFGIAARHMDRQLVGTLAIGLIGHTPISQNARIAEAIAAFRTRDEAVRFSISVRPPGDLEERLLNDEIQIAVGYFWHRVPALHYTPLFIERQVAYCGRGHPLFARAGALTAADAAGFEWAWRSYPLPEAQMSTTPDRVTATADNMEAVALLILSGHHLGYLPKHFAAPYVAQGLLAPLNPERLRYDVTFHMVVARRARGNPIVQAFLEDLARAHQPPDASGVVTESAGPPRA